METRIFREVKIYKLVLNSMSERMEQSEIVAISCDLTLLQNWYYEQFASFPYHDNGRNKVFKRGSPLEWFNPCEDEAIKLGKKGCWGHGIVEEWIPEVELDIYKLVKPHLLKG